MFGLGVPELIFILLLALLIFGPKRLPEIGRTLGKGMSEFRKASNELTRSLNTELALDETPEPPAVRTNRMEALRAARTPDAAHAPEIAEVPAPVAVPETVEALAAPADTPLEPS